MAFNACQRKDQTRRRIHFPIHEKKKDVIILMMWEIGKSYQEAKKEFDRTIGYIKNTIKA